jgi:sugar phosphate isomerase/epimerase
MGQDLKRRDFFKAAAAGAVLASGAGAVAQEGPPAGDTAALVLESPRRYQDDLSPWPIALNTSTIRPQTLREKIAVAAETGYDGIELWINDLEEHEKEGGNLKELGEEIRELGLFVPNIIGLWDSMPTPVEEFEKMRETTSRRMRMSADVGSHFVAAIPAPDRADFDIKYAADRYRDLLTLGKEEYGIIVAFEFVGFLKGIHRLGQAAAIGLDADHPDACLVCDTFHLYRGGSGFSGIQHLDGNFIANFHWNDVPANPPREELGDEHRIHPGDGILPLVPLLRDLQKIGYTRTLSIEMFNREHWEQDPREVAATAIKKLRAQIVEADV